MGHSALRGDRNSGNSLLFYAGRIARLPHFFDTSVSHCLSPTPTPYLTTGVRVSSTNRSVLEEGQWSSPVGTVEVVEEAQKAVVSLPRLIVWNGLPCGLQGVGTADGILCRRFCDLEDLGVR